mmetsp:Transcript_36008/g.67044  ORF Transcript_36008/g.67044 Transcript_36008/m.67044 type:complete len:82 (-) Transcript_36008:274-519(-)
MLQRDSDSFAPSSIAKKLRLHAAQVATMLTIDNSSIRTARIDSVRVSTAKEIYRIDAKPGLGQLRHIFPPVVSIDQQPVKE